MCQHLAPQFHLKNRQTYEHGITLVRWYPLADLIGGLVTSTALASPPKWHALPKPPVFFFVTPYPQKLGRRGPRGNGTKKRRGNGTKNRSFRGGGTGQKNGVSGWFLIPPAALLSKPGEAGGGGHDRWPPLSLTGDNSILGLLKPVSCSRRNTWSLSLATNTKVSTLRIASHEVYWPREMFRNCYSIYSSWTDMHYYLNSISSVDAAYHIGSGH